MKLDEDEVETLILRAEANLYYCNTIQFAVHDKIELIGQAAGLQMSLKERCKDIIKLLRPLINQAGGRDE
jgi:hypothetical protein